MKKTVFITFLLYSSLLCAQTSGVIQESKQRFHPVMGRSAVVSVQEALAAHIGLAILKQGGNAVDAAVAIGFALTVTLPRAGNLGGGGFMLIWLNDKKQAVGLNYRERAPLLATKDMFLNAKGRVDLQAITRTYRAVGVPGTVAGLSLALKKYGTMTLKQVINPAIQLAKNGIIVTQGLAEALCQDKDHLSRSKESKKIFFKADGRCYQVGERLRRPALARTLRLIANRGPQVFYRGEIADAIVKAMKKHQGLITKKDLQQYRAQWVKPVRGVYHGYPIIAMPPPSSGGVTLIQLANILEHFPLATLGVNSAASLHILTEAMNLAYNNRNHYLGDPHFVHIPMRRLLSKKYGKVLAERMNEQHHTPAASIAKIPWDDQESQQTTHFSVLDKEGNMVANTYTLNYSFGNGYTVPGTGILLNNEMDDFTAKPGAANSFGLVQGGANNIAPGKQPLSSMTPTLVLTPEGEPLLALGSPGGAHIITSVLQVIINIIDHHMNIATAVSVPRIHSQLWPDILFYEQGISDDTLRLLQQKGHQLKPSNAMGSVEIVARFNGRQVAFADPRRIGATAVGD